MLADKAYSPPSFRAALRADASGSAAPNGVDQIARREAKAPATEGHRPWT